MRLASVLGDSISTFEGYTSPGYAVYYDRATRERNGLKSVYDVWWAAVIQAMGAYLGANDAFSGSRVTGTAFPAATDPRRIEGLTGAYGAPTDILVYLGMNDFGYGVPLRKKRSLFAGEDLTVFEDAYVHLLKALKQKYPEANIICGTVMRTSLRGRSEWQFPVNSRGLPIEDYNQVIRDAALRHRCPLADLGASSLRYETLDGTHPTAEGHRTLALAWIDCLGQMGLLPESG